MNRFEVRGDSWSYDEGQTWVIICSFISIGHADFSDAFQQLQVSIEDSVYY